jgi:hypothetical protein
MPESDRLSQILAEANPPARYQHMAAVLAETAAARLANLQMKTHN